MALDVATIGIGLDTSEVRKGTSDLNKLGEEARKAADKTLATEIAFDKLSRSMGGFNRVAGIAAGYFTITAIAGLAKEIVKVADAYTNVSSRLQVATGSYELAAQAQEKLFAVSQKTRVSFTETSDLFSKLTTSTQSLNISQDRLVNITATVNKAITLSGASATASQAALVQFGQGLASGTLRGEELNSILEQTPALAKALADGLGVPVGALKQLGSEGKITSDKIIEAFEKVASSVDKDFAKVATTVDSSMTVLKNSLGKAINQANETTGATNNIATAILELSAEIDDFTKSPEFSAYLVNIKTAFTGIGEAVGAATSAISSLVSMAADNQGTLKFLAELAVGLRGAAAGASAGAAVGSVIPGFGTAAGAAIGAGVGYIGGVQATSSVSDAITGDGEIRKREELRKEMERLIALEEKYQGVLKNGAGGSTLFYTNGLTQVRKDLSKVTAEYSAVEGSLQDRFLKGVTLKASEAVTTKTQTAAVKTLTDEQKKAVESYNKFIVSVKQKLEVEKAQALAGRELTDAQKLRLDLEQKLALLTGDKKKAQALIDEVVAQKELNDALAETTKLRDAELKTAQASLRATTEEADKIILQAQSIGKTKEEIQLLIIEKENKRISDLEDLQIIEKLIFGETELAATYGREIDEIRRLQNARRDLGQRQTTQDAIERQRKGYEDLYKDLSKGITDSIFRGFEGGKKFIQSFKDAIKNAFKSLIIKFAVQPVLGSVIGGVAGSLGFTGLAQAAQKELGGIGSIGGSAAGGGASGGSGFGLSEAGGLKSIYDAFAGGVQGLANGATQAAFNLSNFAGASVETSAAIGNFAGAATTAASAIGVAYAGYSLGRGISGGYSLNGGTGNSTVNIGAVVGGFLGAAGGPLGIAIGSAIGSVLGGAVNKLFGKKTVLGASGIQGTFTDDGFSGQTFQDVTVKRKLRSSKSFTNFGAVDSGLLSFLSDSIGELSQAAKSAGLVLGTDISGALDRFTLSGRFSVSTQEQLKATLDSVANAIIKQSIPALEQFKQEGENLIQTAARISTAVAKANTASALLGRSAKFTIDNAQAALNLAANLGDSLNGLQSALAAFIPQSVLASRQIEDFRETIRALGLDTKITTQISREQFAALLQQVDLNSAAGQRELATLIELAPAVDAIIKQRESEQIALLKTRSVLDGLIASVSGTTNAFTNADAAINATRTALFGTVDVQARLELEATLAQQITDRYNLEMQLLDSLQQGVQGVFASIGEVRGGVADARQSIIGTPLQMNAAQIRSQISANAIASQLPTTAGIEAALKKTSTAQSNLDSILGKQSLLDAAKTAFNAVVAKTVSDVNAFNVNTRFGEAYATSSSANGALSGRDRDRASATFNAAANTATVDYAYNSFYNGAQDATKLSSILGPIVDAIKADNAALQSSKATVDNLAAIVATAPAAQSALTAAQSALIAEKKKFSDAIQAFVIDAGKAVSKLSKLREETVKYFEAQSALASLMGSSAAGIRSTVESIRFSKLGETDQLAELQAKFATTFASAQSATGENLASLGDKLNAQLDPLLSLAQSIFGTGTDYQRLEGVLLGQAESIATRLEDFAPKDFQAESLGLLDSIDTQISLIEAATKSAETLIVDAINLSRDKTLEGLRGIVAAVQGGPVTAFATGGAFNGGVVSRPTAFNPGLMGEAGPEAIMPLTNIGGRLGVRSVGSGNAEMAAEIRALRQEVVQLRRENMAGQAAIASGTNRTAKVLERADNGDSLNIMVVTE
jgi:tape measure domain-containing protein